MTELRQPTLLERAASGLPAEATLTVVAALSGGALAPLLPVLTKSLASQRQRTRIEAFFADVSETLAAHEQKLRELSDAQYKLVNEIVLAALHTTQEEKLRVLRVAVRKALSLNDLHPQQAIVLSRIVRDISVEESAFLLRNFHYKLIHVQGPQAESSNDPTILEISPGTPDEAAVVGLTSLGVLDSGVPTIGQMLRFTRVSGKLIALLTDGDA